MDIHNYKRQFERSLERIQESKELLPENKKLILEFKDYLLSEGIGLARINRFLFELMKYNKMLKKPFPEACKDDVRAIVARIEQTDLSAETKKCSKIVLKKLYRFIRKIEEEGKYPEEVEWIKTRIPENHKKLPEELLTEKEIMNIIQKCDNLRDKALISSLAESGCRISLSFSVFVSLFSISVFVTSMRRSSSLIVSFIPNNSL
jgi:site-specific recombinase XerD